MTVFFAFHLAVLAAACGYLLYVAWQDFQTFRIRNTSVLTLVGLFLISAALAGFEGISGQLIAGVALFVTGFGFWAAGLIGAGDAKLLFPVGLFLGWENLADFAIALLGVSTVFYLGMILWVGGLPGRSSVSRRLAEIRATGKVPYGVVIGLAAVAALVL